MKLKKKVFKRTIMDALSKEFQIRIAFSGYDAQQQEMALRERLGKAFKRSKHMPYAIEWTGNAMDALLQTIQVVVQRAMHHKNAGFKGGTKKRLWETELVCKQVFERLGLPYKSKAEVYAEEYRSNCIRLGYEATEPRFTFIERVSDRIVNVLQQEEVCNV
ncbi:hypothetical protein ACFVS2_25180 [Brevibacillus sp. NPDC058079]|uniref:hypothetical protein n=1 Tax=Brevibacillus sp. NPDC058079 TaxID=3346330 RepID=UPI0036E8D187